LKINIREFQRGIQKRQSRENGNIGYTRRKQTKQKHNTIYAGKHYMQIRHDPSYKQLEVKTNRLSFLCGNPR
jgi:hypothetical protein